MFRLFRPFYEVLESGGFLFWKTDRFTDRTAALLAPLPVCPWHDRFNAGFSQAAVLIGWFIYLFTYSVTAGFVCLFVLFGTKVSNVSMVLLEAAFSGLWKPSVWLWCCLVIALFTKQGTTARLHQIRAKKRGKKGVTNKPRCTCRRCTPYFCLARFKCVCCRRWVLWR